MCDLDLLQFYIGFWLYFVECAVSSSWFVFFLYCISTIAAIATFRLYRSKESTSLGVRINAEHPDDEVCADGRS
jgi:hypothetical protein